MLIFIILFAEAVAIGLFVRYKWIDPMVINDIKFDCKIVDPIVYELLETKRVLSLIAIVVITGIVLLVMDLDPIYIVGSGALGIISLNSKERSGFKRRYCQYITNRDGSPLDDEYIKNND